MQSAARHTSAQSGVMQLRRLFSRRCDHISHVRLPAPAHPRDTYHQVGLKGHQRRRRRRRIDIRSLVTLKRIISAKKTTQLYRSRAAMGVRFVTELAIGL